MEKLTQLQKFYKDQFKYNKDNIIQDDRQITEEYSSLEDCTKPKYMPLRKQKFKNKIPKKIEFGLYISKQKYINYISKYTVHYNRKEHLKFRQEGLCISKERFINNEKEIKKIQNMYKNIKKKYDEISGIQKPLTDNKNFYTFSSDSYDDGIYSKKLNNYYYLSKITKLNDEDKVKKIKNNFLKHSNLKKDENEILKISKIILEKKQKNGFSFLATKIRLGPVIGNRNAIFRIPSKNISYITKEYYHDNKNQIIFIQKNLKDKLLKNKNDKIISRKNIIKKNGDTNKNQNKYKKVKNDSFLSFNKNYLINDLKDSIMNDDDISLGLYISKKRKRKIYKKNQIENCLITKAIKSNEDTRQVNIKFLLLTSLFITKNIQQYIFNSIFKNNPEDNFEYPFYLNTITRVLKYLQSNGCKGNNVQKVFKKIFSNFNSNNTIKKDLILLLTEEKEDDLRNINIYESIEQDFLDYIIGFSKFDKKLKNDKFLNVRLNNTIFHNTNIFAITRFIDDEFDNFLNGKYCYKCYLDTNMCKCFKSNDEYTDEALDLGLNDNYNPKNSIKYFEYDNTKTRGTLIQGKPKIDEKDKIISKINFNNGNKIDLLDESRKQNILLNSRSKNYDMLRYFNNDKKDEKIKLRKSDY